MHEDVIRAASHAWFMVLIIIQGILFVCRLYIYTSKYKKVGVLPIRILWSNFSSIGFSLSDEGPMLETLDYTMRIGSTPQARI